MKLILLLTLLGTVLSVPYGPKPEVKKAPIELVIEDICLDKPSELPQGKEFRFNVFLHIQTN